jgi:hypothetical protein
MERVFGALEKTRLLRFDGITYIDNLNARDRNQAWAIYKKQKGIHLQGSYQDEICLFKRQ